MATPGRPIDASTRKRIVKMRSDGVSIRRVANAMRVSPVTVQKILKLPIAK